jgi:hypothetical protein
VVAYVSYSTIGTLGLCSIARQSTRTIVRFVSLASFSVVGGSLRRLLGAYAVPELWCGVCGRSSCGDCIRLEVGGTVD